MWTKAGTLTQRMTTPTAIAGLVSLGGMTLIAVCALPVVRNRFWAIFSYSHVIGFTIMIVGVSSSAFAIATPVR